MSYILIYVILPYIIYMLSTYCRKPKMLFIYLIILTIIRYDNVSDYSMYMLMFQDISKGIIPERISVEYGYIWLNRQFAFTSYGYIYVMAISCISVYYTMYLYFKKYNVLSFAMLLFLAFSTYLSIDNTIRQNLAFAILNFVFFRYLYKNGSLWHIIPAGIIAATFHTSALIVIPMFLLLPYLQRKILSFKVVLLITSLVYILMTMGVFETLILTLVDKLLANLGVISDRFLVYVDREYLDKTGGFSPLMFLRSVLSVLPVLLIDKVEDKNLKMFINITWIVNIITLTLMCGMIGDVLVRITRYLFIFEYLSMAYFILYYKEKLFGIYLPRHFLRRVFIIPLFILSYSAALAYFGQDSYFSTVLGDRCEKFLVYERASSNLTTASERREGRNRFYSIKP